MNGELSRGRGRGNLANIPREVRRPYSAAVTMNTEANEEKPRSTLSAEAKEWFPPNYVPQPPAHNLYQRPTNTTTSAYLHNQTMYSAVDPNFYGSSTNYQQVQHQPQQHGYDRYHYHAPSNRFSTQDRIRQHQQPEEYVVHDSIAHLISVMCEVTFNPGRFAMLSGPLVDSFSESLDDYAITQQLVDAIVNQAIGEANFRYNGARLCMMFDSVEAKPSTPSLFRYCLLERCSAEEAKIVAGGENFEENICGFAMFVAELYMQLDDPQGGRVKALAESLCKVLKHLLTLDNDNSTKNVCQILKLSGLALDADCSARMEEICVMLSAAETAGRQPLLVRNVLNLRRDRWGSARFAEMVDSDNTPPVVQHGPGGPLAAYKPNTNGTSSPPKKSAPYMRNNTNHFNRQTGGNMFYLPDGHNLTNEEAAFLQNHLPSNDQQFSGDEEENQENSDEDIWEPEMDAEQRADFLEFLKMSNQIKR